MEDMLVILVLPLRKLGGGMIYLFVMELEQGLFILLYIFRKEQTMQ